MFAIQGRVAGTRECKGGKRSPDRVHTSAPPILATTRAECACGGDCPRCSQASSSQPTLMRKPADGSTPPGTAQALANLNLLPRAPVPGGDCSATATAPFSAQPQSLQTAIAKGHPDDPAKWFNRQGDNRGILTSIYTRLCNYGLWQHVESVGNTYSGEAPFGIFDVPGEVGHVDFNSTNSRAFLRAVLDTYKFCADHGIAGSQHPNQVSIREVGQSDSLHLALGPGTHFDAHVDRYSSVSGGAGGLCEYDPVGSLAHVGRELAPSKARSKLGIPGLQVFPEPPVIPSVPGSGRDALPPPLVGLTLHF